MLNFKTLKPLDFFERTETSAYGYAYCAGRSHELPAGTACIGDEVVPGKGPRYFVRSTCGRFRIVGLDDVQPATSA